MNTARLERMAQSILNKAKPCPLCYRPVEGKWRFDYQGFTIACTAHDCGCKLERQMAHITPTQIFSLVLKAWNRRD